MLGTVWYEIIYAFPNFKVSLLKFGMDNKTLNSACYYLFMMWLKLNRVSKMGPVVLETHNASLKLIK